MHNFDVENPKASRALDPSKLYVYCNAFTTITESVSSNDFGKISRISVKMFKSNGKISDSDFTKLVPFGTKTYFF